MTALPQTPPTHPAPPDSPASPAPQPAASALTPEMREQFAQAREAFRPLRRALRVATYSAWSFAVFATLSLPFALFSLKGLFIATGLVLGAVFEFRGRRALENLEPSAPRRLAFNQLAFTAVIAVYCVWSAATAWFGPSPYASAIAANPEIGELLEPFADTIRQVTVAAYGLVLLVGLIYQAFLTRYYFTRQKPLQHYLSTTPAWVIELYRK